MAGGLSLAEYFKLGDYRPLRGIDADKLRRTPAPTMPAGFDAAFARVKALVADFRANEKFHLSPAYQEMSFAHWMGEGGRRPDEGSGNRDFIDKFWLALGWDVNHETQKKL